LRTNLIISKMKINFCKFHGFGNDYIVIESDELNEVSSIGEFTKRICHRNTGVGGDGIAVLEKLDGETAHFSCRIINPDGSEAGFSGNGTRCAVAYLYYKKLWQEKFLKLETKSGVKTYKLLKREQNDFWFLAELGKPKFASDEIPFVSETKLEKIVDYQLSIANRCLSVTAINVGNPVAVIFVKDFAEFDWRAIGRKIETHEKFPEKTNVVFVRILDKENIEIRIWERGAGETSSSGTCSIAAAVVSASTNKTNRKVSVHAKGGITEAVWREDGEMLITGRADLAFCGKWIK